MAESKNNIITHGLSGKVGDIIVFSQRGGKTIVSKAPRKRTGEDSEKQKAQQAKFQQAILYGKAVIKDPAQKAIYEATGKSAYNVAVADLLNAPKIDNIDLTAYTGQAGDTIKVRVYDDFQVKAVSVHIYNADGTLLEEGYATEQGIDWLYTATATNSDLAGDKIIVRATDTPDNMSELMETLP